MTYEEKPATGSTDVYFGIEWNESNGTTTFSVQPTIYRWDRYSTSNTGGRWSENITKTSFSGADSWSGLSFGSGVGYRTIDKFSKRSYSKGHSAQTITYHLYTDANFGTWANGWVSLGSQTWTFTMTVPAKASYTVSFNNNGGSGAPSAQTKWYDESLTLSSTKPTRSNYTFKQWNTKSDGTGTAYASGASYTGNAALTLYAIWTPNTYTVSYNANGGSGTTSSQTKTYGVNLTLRSNGFTRTNYVFKNWNTNSGGTGTSYSAGGSYTANAAATLYAQWYAPYTISYNANGGSGAPSAQTKVYNTTLTLSSTRPTRTGYNFKKWNTAQGGTGTNYNPGASYTANAAATLYAQWEVAHYAPTISSLRVQRCDSNGTLNPEGTCCKVTCAWSVDNTTAGYTSTTGSKMKVKVGSFAEVETAISGTSGTTEYVYSANALSIATQYTTVVTVVDSASANNSSSKSAVLTRSFYTMHFKENGDGVGIGTPATQSGFLDVGLTPRLMPNSNGWAGIRFKNPAATTGYSGINFYAGPDGNGDAALFGAGGMTVVGSGESSTSWYSRIIGSDDPRFKNSTAGTETLWLTSDNNVALVSNANTVANRKVVVFNNGGNLVFSEDTADVTSATNGVSVNTYRSFGALDVNDKYYFFCEGATLTNGQTAATLAARNYGTGEAVNNALNLYVANDGTRTVSFTSPTPWIHSLFFWGQLGGLSASQTLTASAAKMPLSTFAGNGCSASSNGIKVTNAGTYFVWASLYLTTGYTVGDLVHLKVYRGSTAISDWIFRIYNASHYSTPHFGPIAVTCSANDVLYLYAYNQTAARGVVASSTSCGLRILRVS